LRATPVSLLSVPARRSSDLRGQGEVLEGDERGLRGGLLRSLRQAGGQPPRAALQAKVADEAELPAGPSVHGKREVRRRAAGRRSDRKSTRLNSIHVKISYDV